ncbi:uncharacterized protein LOC110830773 [Zootermopsis nevadensis]|uniref:uncharacterized protein LOC110830773 n=1 Tax=Zootermopsis nevadensis TaxID=136037 RepID=UPI000B8E88EC|nr:uncharacterized protein LOC110830773 [Zootermopsis nevadensis]XP_021921739.1 uncharacterized protein LOC110830773 [Zootermopsis nevadensis]
MEEFDMFINGILFDKEPTRTEELDAYINCILDEKETTLKEELDAFVNCILDDKENKEDNMHQDYQQHRIQVEPKKHHQQKRNLEHGKETPKCPLAVVRNQRVRRPPNAFILYSSEWRKRMSLQYPHESNNEISVRATSHVRWFTGVNTDISREQSTLRGGRINVKRNSFCIITAISTLTMSAT